MPMKLSAYALAQACGGRAGGSNGSPARRRRSRRIRHCGSRAISAARRSSGWGCRRNTISSVPMMTPPHRYTGSSRASRLRNKNSVGVITTRPARRA